MIFLPFLDLESIQFVYLLFSDNFSKMVNGQGSTNPNSDVPKCAKPLAFTYFPLFHLPILHFPQHLVKLGELHLHGHLDVTF